MPTFILEQLYARWTFMVEHWLKPEASPFNILTTKQIFPGHKEKKNFLRHCEKMYIEKYSQTI